MPSRNRLTIALIAALALGVAACGGSTPTSRPAASSGATTAPVTSDAPGTDAPATDTPQGSETPTEPVATDAPTDAPATDTPTEAPSPTGSEQPGVADACSGNDNNRTFFESVAKAVDWTVLCAVLPKGWSVSTGSYRLANGGKVIISYKGPGGATLALSEGAFCAGGDGCVPSGTDISDAALGPLAGTLVGLDDGGFAIVAARGENPSWLMVVEGLDQETSVALGAALAVVGS